ncbi:MAG: diphosphomevalonate decarboxylase [Patescibacteria group bacterium]
MKKTAIAPSNIAFTKYWGRRDEKLRLPANSNISMNLSNLHTTTTVEFNEAFIQDDIVIDKIKTSQVIKKVSEHLDRIRKQAGIAAYAKVRSINNFSVSTGLSSSASGFAALTLASATAADLTLSEKELSILARIGSGSACRSIPDGFVQWHEGSSESSYAKSIFPSDYWDIVDIVVVVSEDKKTVSTTEGHRLAWTSPFFADRVIGMKKKNELCNKYIKERNYHAFGNLIESEALEMHAIMLTSSPSLLYWHPATIALMRKIMDWRKNGMECYFTINTGQNIHVICEGNKAAMVEKELKKQKEVKKTIVNHPSQGASLTEAHLF